MRRSILAIISIFGVCGTGVVLAADKCLTYESAVTIRGKLAVHTATSPQPYYTIKLDTPICVDLAPGDDLGAPASGVVEIQLVYEKAGEAPRQSFVDQTVVAAGRLHGRETERDHTPVLMRVESLKRQ